MVQKKATLKRETTYWLCQGGGWGLYLAVNLVLLVSFGKSEWSAIVTFTMVSVAGLILTHAIRKRMGLNEWSRLSVMRLLPRVFGLSVAGGMLLTITAMFFSVVVFHVFTTADLKPGVLLINVFNLSVVVFVWQAIYFGVHYLENYRRSEIHAVQLTSTLKEAELASLKTQLNPHFLFNALNSIRALTMENPHKAHEAITRLSNILRYTLQSGDAPVADLKTELRIVKDYLELEKIRFEERLRVFYQIDEATESVAVPVMALQTLVENAIKHGISTRTDGGDIVIRSRRENGRITIDVENSGEWQESAGSTRVGLENVRQRLELIYGSRAELRISHDSGRVRVGLELPVNA
jgi:signal transduction histidine kinase